MALDEQYDERAEREERPVRDRCLPRAGAAPDQDRNGEDEAREDCERHRRDDGLAERGAEQERELHVAEAETRRIDEARQEQEDRRSERRDEELGRSPRVERHLRE